MSHMSESEPQTPSDVGDGWTYRPNLVRQELERKLRIEKEQKARIDAFRQNPRLSVGNVQLAKDFINEEVWEDSDKQEFVRNLLMLVQSMMFPKSPK